MARSICASIRFCKHGLRRLISLSANSPPFFVQFLEAIETVVRVAHHFASLRNTAEHVGQVQQTHFVLDNLLLRLRLLHIIRKDASKALWYRSNLRERFEAML